jgi:hypothetical protein
MNAAFMLFQRREGGIHALSAGQYEAWSVSVVPLVCWQRSNTNRQGTAQAARGIMTLRAR